MSGDAGALLVVDDEENNRDLLGRRLEKSGYAVTLAASGREALELIASRRFDLVLLDIMMPGMSGLDVLAHVRRRHGPHELPVIMATALSDSAMVVQALDGGANDYVTKPLEFPVVLARVQAQLRARRAPDDDEAPTAGDATPPGAPAAAPSLAEALGTRIRAQLDGAFSAPEALVGQVLAGKYRLESVIGTGAFGAVFQAAHLKLRRKVAVKILLLSLGTRPEDIARFQREAIFACRIQHPHAVQVLDVDVAPAGWPYLVMELLEGRNLAQELRDRGTLPPARCLEILLPVCDALCEVHASGIIHRDLKPANIFLHRGRHGEVVKVVDFGLAKLVGDAAEPGGEELTGLGQIPGTPAYMSPERWRNQPYDGKADVYSLGVILYSMVAGQMPFRGIRDLVGLAMQHQRTLPPPLREICPALPEGLADLVHRALEKEPAARPTARAFAREMAAVLGTAIDPFRFPSLAVEPGPRTR